MLAGGALPVPQGLGPCPVNVNSAVVVKICSYAGALRRLPRLHPIRWAVRPIQRAGYEFLRSRLSAVLAAIACSRATSEPARHQISLGVAPPQRGATVYFGWMADTRRGLGVVLGSQPQRGTSGPSTPRRGASVLEIDLTRIVQNCIPGKREVLGFEHKTGPICAR